MIAARGQHQADAMPARARDRLIHRFTGDDVAHAIVPIDMRRRTVARCHRQCWRGVDQAETQPPGIDRDAPDAVRGHAARVGVDQAAGNVGGIAGGQVGREDVGHGLQE
ncbi:hypothetical protein VSR71_15350 [Cupriavidus oxalaticus]